MTCLTAKHRICVVDARIHQHPLIYLCREWTGDLKKLPNIKLRKVSNKGLDTKNEEEEKAEAEAEADNQDDEDDLDDEQVDDAVLMSDLL